MIHSHNKTDKTVYTNCSHKGLGDLGKGFCALDRLILEGFMEEVRTR